VPEPRRGPGEDRGLEGDHPGAHHFVDIAGLVRGASKGEGLGNQFLANIRDCDAVAFVSRCFVDDDITHVEGRVDPIADLDIIETELMLADLESLEKRRGPLEKKARGGDKEARHPPPRRSWPSSCSTPAAPPAPRHRPEDEKAWRMLQLLTSKPALYVCNVEEGSADKGNALSAKVAERAARDGAAASSSPPASRARSPCSRPTERKDFLETMGLTEPGLNRLIREAYKLLGLQTYFTVGPKEARAWTIRVGDTAPAGRGGDPHGLREGLHPRRDHRLRRLREVPKARPGPATRQDAPRGQGVRRAGRRRDALPLQAAGAHPSKGKVASARRLSASRRMDAIVASGRWGDGWMKRLFPSAPCSLEARER
jgi:hypothetical protein